jgi:hypothetical protein
MDPVICPNCKATLPPQEVEYGWCENCGKKLPAWITSHTPGSHQRPAYDREDDAVEYSSRRPKSRHGCATAWLIFMIIANAAVMLLYLVSGNQIKQNLPNSPDWVLPVLIGLGALNVVFAVFLLAWKKWAFYGFAANSILILFVNLAAGLGAQSVSGLVGIAILYGVLQIGGERSTWNQLE